MNVDRIPYLLNQLADNVISREEALELLQLIQESGDESLSEAITEKLQQKMGVTDPEAEPWKTMFDRVVGIDKPSTPVLKKALYRLPVFRWAAAAAIIVCVSMAGVAVLKKQNTRPPEASEKIVPHDIDPGSDRAVLVLADGRKIVLDNRDSGILFQEGNATVMKGKQGQLLIESTQGESGGESEELLMVQTPAGGKYSVVLSDGTKVWLNAASTLRMPAVFSSGARKVELTGEGYFEVAKQAKEDASQPFTVATGRHAVRVLGTHFNIKAYADDALIQTTLLEGSVEVSMGASQPQLLKPGQQATIQPDASISVKNADVEGVIAWKNNLFRFYNDDVQTVMRQIARWYNVDIRYGGDFPRARYTGYISRDVPISNVLKMLRETGDLDFTLENRSVLVHQKKGNP